MVWQANRSRRKDGEEAPENSGDIRSLPYLITISVVTSIDALAVGLSFSVLGHPIWGPAAVIGAVTFIICIAGFWAGRRAGALLGKWAELTGGLILIGIGLKILIEHLIAGN